MAVKLEWIQVLRAVAAVFVLVGHLTQNELRFLSAHISPLWTSAGASGVDLFFVLSGFVMVHVTRHAAHGSGADVARFLYARVTRIYPAYWVATLAALAGYAVMGDSLSRGVGELNLVTSFLLWPEHDLPVLLVGWTLIHELYFYLVFALLLLAPRRLLPGLLIGWIALIALVGALAPSADAPTFLLITHPLTAEFALGCAVGLVASRGRGRFARPAIALGAVWWIAVTAGIPWTGMETMPTGWWRVLGYGAPAALLVYAAACRDLDAGGPAPRPLVAMGDWSYALYLVHLPIVAALARLWAGVFPDGDAVGSIGFIVTGAVLSVAAAATMHHLFEKPVLAFTRKAGGRMFPAARQVADTPREATKLW